MNRRERVIKVEGTGVDNDAGFILVYDCGDRVSLVASAEKSGDTEIISNKSATAALAEALSGRVRVSFLRTNCHPSSGR